MQDEKTFKERRWKTSQGDDEKCSSKDDETSMMRNVSRNDEWNTLHINHLVSLVLLGMWPHYLQSRSPRKHNIKKVTKGTHHDEGTHVHDVWTVRGISLRDCDSSIAKWINTCESHMTNLNNRLVFKKIYLKIHLQINLPLSKHCVYHMLLWSVRPDRAVFSVIYCMS